MQVQLFSMANQRSECLKLTKIEGKKQPQLFSRLTLLVQLTNLTKLTTAVHVDAALRNQRNLQQSAGVSIQFTCTG